MYLDFLVKTPFVQGKITRRKKKDVVYIEYEYDRIYDPVRQYTFPKRVTIGKLSETDPELMQPNQNFLKYFPDAELPETKNRTSRSSCLRVGAYFVLRKIIEEFNLVELLGGYFEQRDLGLFLDLAVYSIIAENNAAQYYPDYTYNHPLFTNGMKQYSDSTVSDFLNSVTDDQSIGFLNSWNETRNHREKIYISYDSTNKNCQAGDIEMVEFGHPKVDVGQPVFNYAVAYDTHNQEPLFYEKYPGSLNDISQLQFMLDRAFGYGYKKIGFILDRGYFSCENIQYMDKCEYSFVIMVKGLASLVNELVLEHKGTFESKRVNNIYEYGVYGKTVKHRLYAGDKKERYFHLYHSISKESAERAGIENRLNQMTLYLKKYQNKVKEFGPGFEKYFNLHYDEKTQAFVLPEERCSVVERELDLAGYFCIITSEKMSAKEAIELYKSHDTSEKLFRGDKSYLGNKSIRVYSEESARAKIFVEFVAMILRCKMYTKLKEEMKKLEKKPNYMTVPAALKELEKIEMVRQLDNVYRLDHAVTANQKTILNAFGLDANHIKNYASELSKELKKAE
ncbi:MULTISPECIES: IS1634 family transposase [unclassified Ruminococcus]|uniref:IS1634 family transposase n=1 Tax=unclassified Ruminococcus TaxID=2608920 RepID=UPI00189FC91C|nr:MULTISPECIES: transposase [unclassified Ruminococcus]MDB8781908.1 transposase [Ruminococcus sp. 1001136sp1]